ncbi:MAG: acetylglutamate kinase [Pseudomonadota bacterium]
MIDSFKKFYRQIFQGKLFVIKVSGQIITDTDARENLIKNIKELIEDNINVLLIYGGGAAIDEALKDANLDIHKIDGRRISSKQDIKVIKKTLAGDLGFKILESLVKEKLPSNMLNALPPHWGYSKRREDIDGMERYDGTVQDINANAVKEHFISTNLAVFPCLAFTDQGTALNINADNMAVTLATQINADKLILITNIDGVQKNNETISVLTASESQKMIDDDVAVGGMRVKLENCIYALRNGVKRVHIINGFTKNSLCDEVYSTGGVGTMIVREKEKQKYFKEELENSGDANE